MDSLIPPLRNIFIIANLKSFSCVSTRLHYLRPAVVGLLGSNEVSRLLLVVFLHYDFSIWVQSDCNSQC